MRNEVKILKESIQKEFLNSAFDLSQEYAEIGLDQLLDNQAFKEIPVVKTIVGSIKGVLAIRELVFARKLAVFFQQFHKGLGNQEDAKVIIVNLTNDTKKRDRIIEQVIVMNERYIDSYKSVIHANLLLAHLKHKLTWDELSGFLISLDMLHPMTIELLRGFYKDGSFRFPGAFDYNYAEGLTGAGLGKSQGSCVTINSLGQKFCTYGLNENWITDLHD